MKLKVFTKNHCPNCPPAKKLAEEIEEQGKLPVEYHDVDEPDGLAEAQFFNVLATPALILCDDKDKEVESWRKDMPASKEIYDKIL
ncbi:MAG: thioredoxin family protein [Patescibacteria group bacterium]|nr:thioredoxin family protein [Patescibacteria group bacterium]